MSSIVQSAGSCIDVCTIDSPSNFCCFDLGFIPRLSLLVSSDTLVYSLPSLSSNDQYYFRLSTTVLPQVGMLVTEKGMKSHERYAV